MLSATFRTLPVLVAVLAALPSAAADRCREKLPSSLRASFARELPRYRQVLVSDYDPDTVRNERRYHDGDACLAVESGDFDADRRRDYVFLALRPKGTVRAFVALRTGDGWRVRQLWDLNETAPGCCYVNVLPPGRYENVYGTEPDPAAPPARDERLALTSRAQGAIVGSLESTGVGFFLAKGRWLHVWLSD